jgi:hypothetical protein
MINPQALINYLVNNKVNNINWEGSELKLFLILSKF